MADRKYCTRCGKPCVQADSATEEIWRCLDHGVMYKAPLPAAAPAASPQPPAAPAPAAESFPPIETTLEPAAPTTTAKPQPLN